MKDYTPNGIEYTWELAGPDGAAFILFPLDKHTKEDINTAKQYLRNYHDVVTMRLANDSDRDYIFKSEYFRHPACQPLKWYQIEQDDKLIRTERIKGTTPAEFVERFVLPFTKETEEKFLASHGEKIYNL